MSDSSRLISNKRPFPKAKADLSSAVCWLLPQYRAVVTRRSLISCLSFSASLTTIHARPVEVKNVSTEVSERQALSNLIRCSRSREPIMTHDSVSLFPTVSWRRSGNLLKRLRSWVGMPKLLEWFLLFFATLASSQSSSGWVLGIVFHVRPT
jgi:hypothetical protein